MRGGGRILIAIVIALAIAILAFFFLRNVPGIGTPATDGQIVAPTTVPSRQIVVARIDIDSNVVLTDTETLLTIDSIPEPEYNANPQNYFTDPNQLATKITINQITANRPVLASDVTDAGLSLQIPDAPAGQARTKAYPFQVNNLTGVADEITPGDFVDVIASFSIQQTFLRPGVDETGQALIKEEALTGQSTKTLIQNVRVLKIRRPQVAAEGTPTPEAQQEQQTDPNGNPVPNGAGPTVVPNTANTLSPGNWILLLALTDQQAEVLKFAQEQGTGVSLVLRGRGDTATEQTTGITLEILTSQYGLPEPGVIPPVNVGSTQATPVPAAPTPTATP